MYVVVVSIVLGVASAVPCAGRWLRVAQREHYIAPWTTRLAWLWLVKRPLNLVLALVALVLAALALQVGIWCWAAVAAIVILAAMPLGLAVRGRTSKLAWTDRLRRLAVLWGVLVAALGTALFVLVGPAGIAFTLLLLAPLTDLCLAILAPVEKALSHKYLVSARKRLGQVRPTVVAVTGSYGKTSTKGYIAHLLGARFAVVASPASFNNLMGLSRSVNERVVPGTEIFVAEMGVYGRGEIRELSKSFPPDIAAITTIGEAHLARMGSKDVIFQAKAEITEKARIVVLPIDEPELAGLADTCEAEGKRVIRVSVVPGSAAQVIVDAAAGTVSVTENGAVSTAPVDIPGAGHAVNIAVAVGIAVALDVPLDAIAPRLHGLPTSANRAEIQTLDNGLAVIDDTYNANPVGAARALEEAAELAKERGSNLVVVTPGMIELGRVQHARNAEFARSIAAAGGYLFAVARVNRRALVEGASGGQRPVRTFDQREPAVAAALDQAGDRGVILYENDLPDHYP